MRVPTAITVNCLLEPGKSYPAEEGYSAEDYVLDTMAYTMSKQIIANLDVEVTPSTEVLHTGEPESYKYSTTAYVFTKKELDEFVADIKKAVNYDIQTLRLLNNCQGAVN